MGEVRRMSEHERERRARPAPTEPGKVIVLPSTKPAQPAARPTDGSDGIAKGRGHEPPKRVRRKRPAPPTRRFDEDDDQDVEIGAPLDTPQERPRR